MRRGTLEQRFLSRINKNGSLILKTKCWEWTGYKQHNGYGRIGIQYTTEYVHRVSWRLFKSKIPDGLFVCHKCDNPPCVNPTHLFLGTATDNMQDASRKGRIKIPKTSHASDETHQVSKLTNEQVKFIRSNRGYTNRELSEMFGVGPFAITMARNFRSFKDMK